MIKSSDKTNSALVSGGLRQFFTTSIVVCLVIYAVISLLTAIIDFTYYDTISTLFHDLRNEVKSQDPFYIIYTSYEDVYMGMILGFLLGFFQFRFLSDKNACYTRLSFGIKRKALFYSNAFYPLICAIFIVFISKLLAVIVNICYLGLHVNIIKMFILSVLATVIPIIFAFTVTTIANVLTTRKLETILLTVSVIALPYALFSLIGNVFSITLYGYGEDPFAPNEISNLLSKINPSQMLFDFGEFDYFSYRITEKISFGGEILWCILCIGACIGALLLTANFFEKRFKPENCGKKGVSKLSVTLISLATSAIISASILETTSLSYTYTALDPEGRVILAVVAGIVGAIVINLLVMLGKKKIKQGLLGAGISAGVMALLIVIGLTGCFGFSNKVPDTDDIESISVHIPFDDMYENAYNHYFEEAYSFSYIDTKYMEDFEIIKNIHENAIKTKGISQTSVECYIEYTLKNGNVIRRNYYDVSEETANEYLKLWDTNAIKHVYKMKLNQRKPDETPQNDLEVFDDDLGLIFENRVISPTDYLIIASKDNTFTDLSHPTDEQTHTVPTEEINLEIMTALYKDICNISAEEWFMPKEQYGALIFDCAQRSYDNSVSFEEAFSEINSVFYINGNMTNTVNTLKKYGYFQYFECNKEVEKAHIITSDNLARWAQVLTFEPLTSSVLAFQNADVKHGTYYTINNFCREEYLTFGCDYLTPLMPDEYSDYYTGEISEAYPEGSAEYYDFSYDESLAPPIKDITDTAEAASMVKNAFMAYNLGNSGEFIVAKFTDGSCTILAIPE